MTTTIERMAELDGATLLGLFEQSGETNIRPNPDFFTDEKNVLLVSRTNGVLSGFLWAYVLQSPDSPHGKVLLYSIDVFKGFRRRGIATDLIAQLKRIAVVHGCSEIFVPTRKGNTAAMALYTGSGFKAEGDDDVVLVWENSVGAKNSG